MLIQMLFLSKIIFGLKCGKMKVVLLDILVLIFICLVRLCHDSLRFYSVFYEIARRTQREKLRELGGNKCRMIRIPTMFAEWKRLSHGVETANASET